MNKKKILRIIFGCLLLIWMGVIFIFSAQNGEESSSTSGTITDTTIEIIYPNYDSLPNLEQESIFSQVSHFIRKSAHFIEYFILGCLACSFLLTFKIKKIGYIIFPTIFSFLYAGSDELHQFFTDDRGPSWKDVMLDTSGAFCGIILLCLIVLILYPIIFHRKEKA